MRTFLTHILTLLVMALNPMALAAQDPEPVQPADPVPATPPGGQQGTPQQSDPADLTTLQDAAPMFPGMPGMAPMPMPTDNWAVAPHDFAVLLNLIQNQTFASNQLPMIQAAGLCGWFTCQQCAALMNLFDFDDNKLKVVTYLAPHLIDPIRCQPIMQSLSFVSNQQKAWRIISAARP